MVISNHFLSKDLVHHPIDSEPLKKNGWPFQGSRQYFTLSTLATTIEKSQSLLSLTLSGPFFGT